MSAAQRLRIWITVMLASMTLSLVAIPMAIAHITEAMRIQPGTNMLEAIIRITDTLDWVAKWRSEGGPRQVVYLGDSTVAAYRPGRQLPRRLQRRLDELGADTGAFRVTSLANPGIGVYGYSLLADRIAEARPDQVVWQLSFVQLSRPWTQFVRRELVGWMDLSRLPQLLAMVPETRGITLDSVLLHRAIVSVGGAREWHALRETLSRVAAVPRAFAAALAPADMGDPLDALNADLRWARRLERSLPERLNRFTAEYEREHLGSGLTGLDPSHPGLVALADAVRRMRAAGIDVLVYLNPVNLEHLEQVGVLDRVALGQSVAAMRAAVEPLGGRFLDFHDLLGDEYFRDGTGHIFDRDGLDGPAPIVTGVAEALVQAASESRE